MTPAPPHRRFDGTLRRIRQVMVDAPWSNFDLMSSSITFWIGVYLLLNPTTFEKVGGVYLAMAQVAEEWVWGTLFTGLGTMGLVTVLWCIAPKFGWRLLARMGVAFCLLSFALNNLAYSPPPLSFVTYSFLSIWAMWGVLRTRSSGR